MARILLRKIEPTNAEINFHVPLDVRGASGYETNVRLIKKGDGWVAEMQFNDMPPQSTPEEAIDRLGLYLKSMSKSVKGRNIKHLNVDGLFKPVHK